MTPMFGTVVSTERITPSMIRVVFGGVGLDSFEIRTNTDQYVKAQFLPDGSPIRVPFDVDDLPVEPADRPRSRRYTVRAWDPDERLLTMDFVSHGDSGYAGRWAANAKPGDRLQFSGPSGSFHPNPEAELHLFIGDESALPAIAASLESLPGSARAEVIALVDGPDHELELASPADTAITWLHREPGTPSEPALLAAVGAIDWPDGFVDAFVKGEAGEVRTIRRELILHYGITKENSSISAYWRRDHTDEAWRAVKKQWIADEATDTEPA